MGPRRLGTLLAAILLAATLLSACEYEIPTDMRYITDGEGRALVLHGANVSSGAKNSSLPMPDHTRDDVLRMGYADWGMNVARVLVQWDAIEPEPGVYDEAYLDAVAERMRWFEDAGVYVILDMHQDVYGPAVGGNGAPAWATRTNGVPVLPPFEPWWLNYLQPAVNIAFANFWKTAGANADVREHFVAMWRHVADRFAGDPALLGYDILNEPYPGGSWAGFENNVLTPFYQDVIDAIREVDMDGWVFVEPKSFGANQGVKSSLRLGTLVDPREGEARVAYYPHLYTPDVDLGGEYNGDTTFIDFWAQSRVSEINRGPMPMLIGEFGRGGSSAPPWTSDVLDMAEDVTSGWTWWSYEICDGCWGLVGTDREEHEVVGTLVRTYARAIAGRPLHRDYDVATRVFEVSFAETGVTAPTEIFVPEARHYPEGFTVSCSDPDGSWSSVWDAARQILEVTTDPAQAEHTITITPN
ncbi:MAG: cellulase family glycosylhydrolase [Acidimicrobiia bacterium]|nr:cellulase family glycosylhydrolase [Acidimicrobiia bacterium]